MKLGKLKIQKGLFSWTFDFSSPVTLIYSQFNILRFLLYTIGFSIPNTKGLKMEDYTCFLNIINDNYIFTSDLKSLSGAVFHKIVFSFKLAYIKCLQHYTGITVPIILDSLRGKENDETNIEEMFEILKKDFCDHQIIIASIYDSITSFV